MGRSYTADGEGGVPFTKKKLTYIYLKFIHKINR